MKKIIKVLLVILCLILGILIYALYKVNEINITNRNIMKEINRVTNINNAVVEVNQKYETEINRLKEESKDKSEELETWKKAKEKVMKALP